MKVAVSMRVVENDTYPEARDAISHDWLALFDRLGVTPILVPNVLTDPVAFIIAAGAQGLLLTGGNDVGPIAGETGAPGVAPDRDRTEFAVLAAAIRGRSPVFGVCRGLQVINAWFGGSIERRPLPARSHVATDHWVDFVASPAPGVVAGQRWLTNSYHDQAVTHSGLAPVLRPFATVGDVVEGLYHPELPIIAVQWHPERATQSPELDRALLGQWLSQCG